MTKKRILSVKNRFTEMEVDVNLVEKTKINKYDTANSYECD